MPRCGSCIHFRTDGDCDGPEVQWCALERHDSGYNVSEYPACRLYVERDDDEYDWED
ncbi:MAG: hypothetical protein J6L90_01760 [Clostridia bacterium]|nr:hypothetical protein [Clostridia bacterium]MBQ2737391.1 hypothetical protein [Clostridia bacterium]